MPRWRVDIIRKRAEHLGTVEASTEKEARRRPSDLAEAVVKTMAEFNIPEERRNRLIVQKIGKVKD